MSDIKRHWNRTDGNIAGIGYDLATKTLEVIFRDVPEYTYSYANVGAETFCELLNAESVGGYFAKSIRKDTKKYPFTKNLTNTPITGTKET